MFRERDERGSSLMQSSFLCLALFLLEFLHFNTCRGKKNVDPQRSNLMIISKGSSKSAHFHRNLNLSCLDDFVSLL